MRYIILLILIISSFVNAEDKAFYNDRERGWYWYETPPEDIEEHEEKEIKVENKTVVLTPKEIIADQRERFDNALSTAIVNPTKENIIEYLKISQEINSQAHKFSDSFKKTIWVEPEYDYSLKGRPTSTQAIAAYSQEKIRNSYATLNNIANNKGIIFFFRSDCPYCTRLSPILKQFSEQFGFTVIPVTLDGRGNTIYPYPKNNHSLASRLNVNVVPALFLVDPDENEVSTIGYGYTDWTGLIAKVLYAHEQMENVNNTLAANNRGVIYE